MQKDILKFKNGKFKIMLVGDLHEKYDLSVDNRKLKSEDGIRLLNKAADEIQPDLVVFLGDNSYSKTEGEMREVLKRIITPFSQRDIPFTTVFGNHDHDCQKDVDLQTQMRLYNEYDNCLFYNDDDSITGCGNHNLTIKASASEDIIYNLWFIDSNNLCEDKAVSKYDWVHYDQIKWYENKAEALKKANGGRIIPALLFQHIPVMEEYRLLREAKPWEYFDSVEGHSKMSDKRYMPGPALKGYLGEAPASPDVNSGQFDSWKKTGDIKGAFFGHDHMNDFTGYVDGIMLGQCKTAGYQVYTDGGNSGVRVITLDENNPDRIDTRFYYAKKDFKLKAGSLSPYMRHFTDRQDLKLKAAGAVCGFAAAVVTGVSVIRELKKH